MPDNLMLVKEMQRIIKQSGGGALEMAKHEIASKFASDDDISLALKYFARVTLRDALPVFSALVSISCEAVGGLTDRVDSVGGAIILIAGAADLHDDAIDESPVKNGRRTVLGRFGRDVTILAGDTLLVWGLARLQKECELIPREQGGRILDLLTRAILEISHAEVMEARLRAEKNLSVEACMNIIELKAVVPEVSMKIGAVLGNGDDKNVETLGHFGKVFGIVSTVAEEFMDVLEFEELKNRLKSGYPPLPFLCALQNPKLRRRILSLQKRMTTKKKFEELKELVVNCAEAQRLKKDMSALVQNELDNMLSLTENVKSRKKLENILTSSLLLLERIDC